MKQSREKEEYLELLWNMKEKNIDDLDYLIKNATKDSDQSIIKEMVIDDLIHIDNDKVRFTPTGEDIARRVIRAHRLAERLIYDALGGNYEHGACEFEHMVNSELVDSICILLGHPRECPHGRPIPKGECCESAVKVAECAVIPLIDLPIHHASRVAYVNGHNDCRMNKLDTLQIRPGVLVKMEQKTPSIVIQCEGSDIAIDTHIASEIYVWKECPNYQSLHPGVFMPGKKCGKGHGFRLMQRWRNKQRNCNETYRSL